MKKALQFSILLAGFVTMIACSKSNTTPSNNNNNQQQQTACNGKKLCFKKDGTDESYDAVKWRLISVSGSPDRTRVTVESGSGNSYMNIEIDAYGTTTGTYNISANPKAGDAGFQYFVTNGNHNIQGVSGTIEITNIDQTNNTVTGKFTVSAEDKNNNNKKYEFTDGNFVNVPKQ